MKNKKPVKIIAHRGANRGAPQNTMPAFALAVEQGCDGFETDVHLTKDGVPVICHNYTIDAMSDGTGEITSYTLDELKLFDFGSYFSEEYKDTPLPTLDEFLDYVAGLNKIINIEIKCPRGEGDRLVLATLESIRKHGCLENIIISSFSPAILKAVKKFCPECKTAFLYPIDDPKVCLPVFFPFVLAKSIKADILHPFASLVNPTMVKIAHKLGFQVNVWTVDDRVTGRYLVKCGVDGIITDVPGKMREYIEK